MSDCRYKIIIMKNENKRSLNLSMLQIKLKNCIKRKRVKTVIGWLLMRAGSQIQVSQTPCRISQVYQACSEISILEYNNEQNINNKVPSWYEFLLLCTYTNYCIVCTNCCSKLAQYQLICISKLVRVLFWLSLLVYLS